MPNPASASAPEPKPDSTRAADSPQPLSEVQAPRAPRPSATHSLMIPNLSGPQMERLSRHAEAMGLDPKEAARALFLRALEGPIEDSVQKQREMNQAQIPEVKCVTVEVEVTRGKPKEKRTFLQVQLDDKQKPYVTVWQALIHGLTDRFHLSTHPALDGKIPFCIYPDSPYDLEKMLIASRITSDVSALPRLDSTKLDVLSPAERSEKMPEPIVYGLPADKVARLIEKTEPVIQSIKAQLSAAKARHSYGGISGIETGNKDFPSLSEQEMATIGRIQSSCKALLK